MHHSVAKVHVRLLLALGYDSSEYFIFFIPLNTFGFGHITWPTLHLFTFEFNESSRAPAHGPGPNAKSRSGPACPTPPPCSPKVDPCRQDSEGDMGSGPHTQNEAATASAPTVEPADAGKPGRLQSAPSNPASGSSPIPSFSQFSRGEVSQEAPAPKPCSRLVGCAPPRCGPAPKPQPKPQPKAKGRKDPQPSSQPKLAQFFVAQTRKASTSSHTQGSHKAPACPKPPPCSPGPTQPAPTQVVSSLGLCSHGGGSPEGQGQREG